MVSLNLMFHVTSGVVLVVLVYAFMRQLAWVKFQRDLWSSLDPAQRATRLDWPTKFLQKLAHVWGLKAQLTPVPNEAPAKIEVSTWVRAHIELGIRAVENEQVQRLRVRVRRSGDFADWQQRLEKSLSGRFAIEIVGEE